MRCKMGAGAGAQSIVAGAMPANSGALDCTIVVV